MGINGENTSSSDRRASPNPKALIGLLIALALAELPIASWIAPGTSLRTMLIREMVWWCFAGVILFWLRFVERLPAASIGLRRPSGRAIGYGIAAAVLLMLVFVVHFSVIVPAFH